MQQQLSFQLSPSQAADEQALVQQLCLTAGKPPANLTGYFLVKKSLDARGRQVKINITVQASFQEPFGGRPRMDFQFREVSAANRRVVIIGAGPCGLFAALALLEQGIKPILLERGKDVRNRRRDLARLNKEGLVDPESNYCFGEGGAGTYSDGKLYTRSTKRGDVNRILQLLVRFGAQETILYEAHPHVGTNKLPGIITAIREQITAAGGEFHFQKKVTDFQIAGDRIKSVRTADGDDFAGDAFILATGHSARDIFELLQLKNILLEEKPFALGVRVEHPQQIIDSIQYHCPSRGPFLPPSSYSLVQQAGGRGVFSFCMCPGGIIAPAATAPGEIVVNGWSPSKRNNPFANSGIVVQVEKKEASQYARAQGQELLAADPLGLMKFQRLVEQAAFRAGGGRLVAPAQRLQDFVAGKASASLPDCSYLPGLAPFPLQELLPGFIHSSLQEGFRAFGKKMKGYLTNEAVLVATESRTSSPVRIPREKNLLSHPQYHNLYPGGEGAGYAGGIVSAAMDGENIAAAIARVLTPASQ